MKKYLPLALITILPLTMALMGSEKPLSASAQAVTPQLIITWQADNYAPSGFAGKVLPASDSSITIGADLIDLGRRVDLSTHAISWYINDRLYQAATGLSRINITAPHFIGENSIRVKALVTNYASGVGRTITIPIVPPEVVIQSSAPSLEAAATPFTLEAFPYFFNISDPSELVFGWKLNGAPVSNQKSLLVTAQMAEGRRAARVELSVNNPQRIIERLIQEITIFK